MAPLAPAEIPAAIGVLARGMRDNPIHVAALGADADRRERILARLFEAMWQHMDQHALCARLDGEVVGVCGRLPPGACRPTPVQGLRMAPGLAAERAADAAADDALGRRRGAGATPTSGTSTSGRSRSIATSRARDSAARCSPSTRRTSIVRG